MTRLTKGGNGESFLAPLAISALAHLVFLLFGWFVVYRGGEVRPLPWERRMIAVAPSGPLAGKGLVTVKIVRARGSGIGGEGIPAKGVQGSGDRSEVIVPGRGEALYTTRGKEGLVGGRVGDGESGAGHGSGGVASRPFYPDSLELLLSFPWIAPGGGGYRTPRLFGLERELEGLREREREEREDDSLTVDTKYGPLGISSRGIHLGPLVIPIPLAPYRSAEMRDEIEAHEEIRSQSNAESLRDADLREQRERIIEWKKRNEGGG